jgi:GNAT superfamily N-acetyltransferase
MSFIVRDGQEKDVQEVLDLITELAVFEKEPDAVEITVDDLLRDGFSENSKFKFFVAEENDKIIGLALIYERYSTWKGRTIHLEDLIVTQSKRQLGVGKALYTKFLKYAYSLGVKRVGWEVIDWNTNAINFYKSTGATILEDWSVVQMDTKSLEKYIKNN